MSAKIHFPSCPLCPLEVMLGCTQEEIGRPGLCAVCMASTEVKRSALGLFWVFFCRVHSVCIHTHWLAVHRRSSGNVQNIWTCWVHLRWMRFTLWSSNLRLFLFCLLLFFCCCCSFVVLCVDTKLRWDSPPHICLGGLCPTWWWSDELLPVCWPSPPLLPLTPSSPLVFPALFVSLLFLSFSLCNLSFLCPQLFSFFSFSYPFSFYLFPFLLIPPLCFSFLSSPHVLPLILSPFFALFWSPFSADQPPFLSSLPILPTFSTPPSFSFPPLSPTCYSSSFSPLLSTQTRERGSVRLVCKSSGSSGRSGARKVAVELEPESWWWGRWRSRPTAPASAKSQKQTASLSLVFPFFFFWNCLFFCLQKTPNPNPNLINKCFASRKLHC